MIRDLVSLLTTLRAGYSFVGSVACSAWLDEPVTSGPIDVLALVGADRSGQLPVMAGNRGFLVDREEVEAAEELDLVPMKHEGDPPVRVHVLLASNALYGTMVRDSGSALMDGEEIRIVTAEDYALLLTMGEDAVALRHRASILKGPAFDMLKFNQKLISIGLGERTHQE